MKKIFGFLRNLRGIVKFITKIKPYASIIVKALEDLLAIDIDGDGKIGSDKSNDNK